MLLMRIETGAPKGIPTPVLCLKGRRPSALDDGSVAKSLGFEPRPTVLETVMLPLHHDEIPKLVLRAGLDSASAVFGPARSTV